ncbi:MAG: hypothetical protein RL701_7225 [Pseudomonadota bacterium]
MARGVLIRLVPGWHWGVYMRHTWGVLCLALAVGVVGCSDDDESPDNGGTSGHASPDGGSSRSGSERTDISNGGFVSDGPDGTAPSIVRGPAGSAGSSGSSVPPGRTNAGSDEAGRAIADADLVQLQGDKLYAVSRYGGFAIMDVGQPEALKPIGRYKTVPAEPIEMYMRNGIAMVLYSGWEEYRRLSNGAYIWAATSRLLTLDVSNPAQISVLGTLDIPGQVSASRLLGDVLYVVSDQDGQCWGCEPARAGATAIISLQVKDPRNVTRIASLNFDQSGSNGASHSVMLSERRLYVTGAQELPSMLGHSIIQVVDIGNPDGSLQAGAKLTVKGGIRNHWQMDEYRGVLRVITQTPVVTGNDTDFPLVVQTFQVISAQELAPLGHTSISLPSPDSLQSAHFNGPRAYAATADQAAPLLTIDLSVPSEPRQRSSLALPPGYTTHFEARGERLIRLGIESGNEAGGATISLFDVKDLTAPKLLSHVNFGGHSSFYPSVANLTHKLLHVVDDNRGLILVPISDRGQNDAAKVCGGNEPATSGVQLIDLQNDELHVRGLAGTYGTAQRALIAHDALITVSNNQVQSFAIQDRDQPTASSHKTLSKLTTRTFALENGSSARVAEDRQRGYAAIDFVASEAIDDTDQSLATLELGTLLGEDGAPVCGHNVSILNMFAHGSQLEVVYSFYVADPNEENTARSQNGLVILDATDPAQPTVLSKITWPWTAGASIPPLRYGEYNGGATAIARTDHSIAVLEGVVDAESASVTATETRLRVIDLRDPSHPQTTLFPIARGLRNSGLFADGDTVVTSHFVLGNGENDNGRGRFFVDRIDLADPTHPQRLPDINVPGVLLHYLPGGSRAITSELTQVVLPDLTYHECHTNYAGRDWTLTGAGTPGMHGSELGDCATRKQRLHLVRLDQSAAVLEDSFELSETENVSSSSLGADVLFASIGRSYYASTRGDNETRSAPRLECFDCSRRRVYQRSTLITLSGLASGHFTIGRLTVEDASDTSETFGVWGEAEIHADGTRALLSGERDLAIIDASNPNAPTAQTRIQLDAVPYSLAIEGDSAIASLGGFGVQRVSLTN